MRMRPGGLAVANGDGAKGDWCGPRYALLCSMNTSEADGHQQAGAAWELPQGMLAFDPPAISTMSLPHWEGSTSMTRPGTSQ